MTCRIVAEISANHLGSYERAVRLVETAAAVGADCVKFQTFTPEQMVDEDLVLDIGPWEGRKAIDLYREAHTPREWHKPLFKRASELGLTPFSSVFHPDDVAFLETLDCPIYKISSFEITDLALIRAAARTGKPIVISTGMASNAEIDRAVIAAYPAGCRDLTLLKCTSAYPAPESEANLATMVDLPRGSGVLVDGVRKPTAYGLSDHTLGIGVAVAAVALGASMIEKHLTLRRADGGPDAAFSMEPEEFAQLVTECRRAAAALGTVRYGPTASEHSNVALRRRSGGKRGTLTKSNGNQINQ